MSMKRATHATINASALREVTSVKHAGPTAMNALVAAPAKKMRPHARTKFPFGLFRVRHGGAEKKFNRTGGTAGKTLAGGLALRETATRIRYRRIGSRAASAGRSHRAGGSACRIKTSFHDDLFVPLAISWYPF
jgi:hypothetical protein